MAQITVSLPDDLVEKVKQAAAHAGYATVSDFVRDALREKFSGLDYWQRVQLVMTLENNKLLQGISDKLDAEEPKLWNYRKSAAALADGFVHDYDENLQFVYKDEFSVEQSRFVISVFAMFDDLQRAAEKAGDATLQEIVRFPGYDGNNETSYLGYARYITEITGRFDYLKLGNDGLNSHIRMVHEYKDMLARWEEVKRRPKKDFGHYVPLTTNEVKEVLGSSGKFLRAVSGRE